MTSTKSSGIINHMKVFYPEEFEMNPDQMPKQSEHSEAGRQTEFGSPVYTISGAVDRHNWQILRKGQPFLKISKRTNHQKDVHAMLSELNNPITSFDSEINKELFKKDLEILARQETIKSLREESDKYFIENKKLQQTNFDLHSDLRRAEYNADNMMDKLTAIGLIINLNK